MLLASTQEVPDQVQRNPLNYTRLSMTGSILRLRLLTAAQHVQRFAT